MEKPPRPSDCKVSHLFTSYTIINESYLVALLITPARVSTGGDHDNIVKHDPE